MRNPNVVLTLFKNVKRVRLGGVWWDAVDAVPDMLSEMEALRLKSDNLYRSSCDLARQCLERDKEIASLKQSLKTLQEKVARDMSTDVPADTRKYAAGGLVGSVPSHRAGEAASETLVPSSRGNVLLGAAVAMNIPEPFPYEPAGRGASARCEPTSDHSHARANDSSCGSSSSSSSDSSSNSSSNSSSDY